MGTESTPQHPAMTKYQPDRARMMSFRAERHTRLHHRAGRCHLELKSSLLSTASMSRHQG